MGGVSHSKIGGTNAKQHLIYQVLQIITFTDGTIDITENQWYSYKLKAEDPTSANKGVATLQPILILVKHGLSRLMKNSGVSND